MSRFKILFNRKAERLPRTGSVVIDTYDTNNSEGRKKGVNKREKSTGKAVKSRLPQATNLFGILTVISRFSANIPPDESKLALQHPKNKVKHTESHQNKVEQGKGVGSSRSGPAPSKKFLATAPAVTQNYSFRRYFHF